MNKELFDLAIIEKSKQKIKQNQYLQEQALKDYIKEEKNLEIQEMIRNREINKRNRASLPTMIKESLIYTFLDKLYTVTLEHLNIEDNNGIRYNMINNYIKDNGTINIMNNLSRNSMYLSEVAYQINSLTTTILEKVDSEDTDTRIIDVRVDEDDKNSFLDSVDLGSFDQIADKVAERVQQAQVDFIEFNDQDSKHIEQIIAATQEKINSTIKESYIENYQRDCNYAINKVKSRSKSIYENMVNQICIESYKNDIISEQFLNKDSSLNLPAVLEMTDIMYTFLELCNTIKLENIDESYIAKVYKEITGKK